MNYDQLTLLAEYILEYWESIGSDGCTTREIQDWLLDTHGISATSSDINEAWDLACDLSGADEEDELPIVLHDGEEIYSKEEAHDWLLANLEEHGNTYFWNSELSNDLYLLTKKFGNTYFW